MQGRSGERTHQSRRDDDTAANGIDVFTRSFRPSAGKYDPKYFGTYASHVSEATSTANYVDVSMLYERVGFPEGVVEWYDGRDLRERLTFAQVRVLGGEIVAVNGMIRIGGMWVTPWPRPDDGFSTTKAVPITTSAGAGIAIAAQ